MFNDSELVRRFKSKDIAAFEEIFLHFYKSVNYYILKIVNNKALADDLTQETFIKVFRGLQDVNEGRKLSPWIFRIAHNTCVDYLRKKKIDFELIDNIDNFEEEYNNPEYSYLNKETSVEIKKALNEINQRYQIALVLRDFNSLSYKEIASTLNINISSVKSLIYRARQEFQKAYREVY